MKVTLYKKCILSSDYNEVFDTKISNVLEDYLNTLENYVVNIENTYTSFSGKLNFNLTNGKDYNNIYSYNYCKIENQNFIRYCFIDSIKILNDIAVVYYSEDIWHSYARSINIRNSLLTNTRSLNYTDLNIKNYVLPINYDGNNKLNITPKNEQCLIVGQLQIYELASGWLDNKIGGRNVKTVILGGLVNSYKEDYVKKYDIVKDIDDVEEGLNLITLYSSDKNFNDKITSSETDVDLKYAELNNIYLVPLDFGLFSLLQNNLQSNLDKCILGGIKCSDVYQTTVTRPTNFDSYMVYDLTKLLNLSRNKEDLNDFVTIKTISLQNNFKRIGIGTLNNILKVENNGNSLDYSIQLSYSSNDIRFYLNCQNQLKDITKDFEFIPHFNPQSAEVTAQRSLAKSVGFISNVTSLLVSAISGYIGGGLGNLGKSFSSKVASKVVSPSSTSLYYRKGNVSNVVRSGIKTDYTSNTVHTQGTNPYILETGSNALVGILTAFQPIYETAKSIDIEQMCTLNCTYGIIDYIIISDNDELVEKIKDNTGYIVNEIVNNEVLSPLTNDYNVIKFDFINIYGDFPQDICGILKNIFLNGIKIWYTTEINNV